MSSIDSGRMLSKFGSTRSASVSCSGGLARIIHERFCCNRRSAALAREAPASARIDSLIHLTIDSMVQWVNRQSSIVLRDTLHEERDVATNRHE
jgi:hypothetical protein